jgi:hypothetical protein
MQERVKVIEGMIAQAVGEACATAGGPAGYAGCVLVACIRSMYSEVQGTQNKWHHARLVWILLTCSACACVLLSSLVLVHACTVL